MPRNLPFGELKTFSKVDDLASVAFGDFADNS